MRASAPDIMALAVIDFALSLKLEHSSNLQDLGYALGGKTQLDVIRLLLTLQDEERIRISASVR